MVTRKGTMPDTGPGASQHCLARAVGTPEVGLVLVSEQDEGTGWCGGLRSPPQAGSMFTCSVTLLPSIYLPIKQEFKLVPEADFPQTPLPITLWPGKNANKNTS